MPHANRSMGGGNGGGPCVLYFTLAVDHRLAGRPPFVACAPSNSLQPPSSGRLGARSALQTALLPLPSSLPSSESFSFWPRAVNRAQCWFGLFGLFFCPRSTQSGRPASCLSCLHSHTFTLTLSLSGVGWKKRIALCSSQAAGLSLSLCPASPSRRLTHSSRGIVVGKFDLQLLFLTFSPPPPSSLTPSLSSAARLSEGVFLKANSSKCPAGFLSDILAGRTAHFVRRLGKFSS